MKQNNVIFWVMLTLLVASCSKAPTLDPIEESTEGKVLLSFSIDGFEQENLPFPRASLQSSIRPAQANDGENKPFDLRDYANVVVYKIWKSGKVVDSLRQYASDPNFGEYSRFLPVSKDSSNAEYYQIRIAAAMLEDGQSVHITGGDTNATLSFSPYAADGFFHSSSPVLSEGTEIKSVKLRRVVGRVEVIPTDTIPANAERVEIEVANVAKYFDMFFKVGYYSIKSSSDGTGSEVRRIPILPDDIGKNGKAFASYFMLKDTLGKTAPPRTVTITTFDKQQKVIMKRVVPNVNLQSNQITRLRGPIFSNRPNADFSIELENDWKTEIPEIEF